MRVLRSIASLAALGIAATACNGDMRAYFERDVVRVDEDLAYVEGTSNPRQKLDLYLPRKLTNYPVVVFVHGGYWIAQDKHYFAPLVGLYGNVGFALARKGIGVVVVDYRLVPDVSFEQQLGDVLASVKWTQTHIAAYGGDPHRMVLAGHSAGGHMTALAALQPGRMTSAGIDVASLRGFAPLSPILDLEDMAAHPPESDFNATVTQPVFGTKLKEYSPRTYFTKNVAPMFFAMGDKDEPYLVPQIPKDVGELQALGAPATLLTLKNHSHADVVLNFDTGDDELTPALVEFVNRVTR